MTAQEPFHDFGSGAGCVALCGIVPIALADDRDLVA